MIRQGIFAVYKPVGPTSNDVLNQIRKITGERHVGHAGTLDPLAQGILVVGIGREATKELHYVVESEKEYIAKVRLGMKSTTDDEEGEKTSIEVHRPPTRTDVEEAMGTFVGNILQEAPMYSSIKIGGKEAYKFAREGKKMNLGKRSVEIKEIEVLAYEWPYLTLKVLTGSGVYIRALARDIGEKLKIGGYLASLERTRVGSFTKEKAVSIADLEKSYGVF